MQLTFIGSSMTKRNKSCESEVMLTMQRKELLKKSAIRYAEYYGMVEVQDALYADSASEKIFTNLISIIGSDANIKMAYRNLKSNKGSNTPGVDGKTFKDLSRVRGNSHARFLEGKAPAMGLTYSTRPEIRTLRRPPRAGSARVFS